MTTLLTEVKKLEDLPLVEIKTLRVFNRRLAEGEPYTKPQNPKSHFCVLFIPYCKNTKMVYIGDHIKAQIWSPPGGHIDHGEAPVETIKREFYEELSFKLTNEKIELFAANKTICIPTGICRLHYDLFYIVYFNKQEKFNFEKREYKDASWFDLDNAIRKINYPPFNAIMVKMKSVVEEK